MNALRTTAELVAFLRGLSDDDGSALLDEDLALEKTKLKRVDVKGRSVEQLAEWLEKRGLREGRPIALPRRCARPSSASFPASSWTVISAWD